MALALVLPVAVFQIAVVLVERPRRRAQTLLDVVVLAEAVSMPTAFVLALACLSGRMLLTPLVVLLAPAVRQLDRRKKRLALAALHWPHHIVFAPLRVCCVAHRHRTSVCCPRSASPRMRNVVVRGCLPNFVLTRRSVWGPAAAVVYSMCSVRLWADEHFGRQVWGRLVELGRRMVDCLELVRSFAAVVFPPYASFCLNCCAGARFSSWTRVGRGARRYSSCCKGSSIAGGALRSKAYEASQRSVAIGSRDLFPSQRLTL